jgi:hypothetical protein
VEEEEKDKIGEMSTYLAYEEDGPKKVAAVYSDKSPSPAFNQKAFQDSLDELEELFKGALYELLSVEQAITGERSGVSPDEYESGMDTGTNSGHPWYMPGWYPNDDTPEDKRAEVTQVYKFTVSEVNRLAKELNEPNSRPPTWITIMGQRLTQHSNPAKRKRIIIAFPKVEAVLQKLLSPIAIDDIRQWSLSGGVKIMVGWTNLPTTDIEMQRMLAYADERGRTVLSGDVSNYDATLPPFIIEEVGKVLARHVKGKSRFFQQLNYAMLYNSYLITPTKLWNPQPSSLKSGSGETNLIGSLVNMAIQLYGVHAGLYKLDNMVVLGDDFCLDGDGVSPEATAECFKHFNMESHPDKQFHEQGALHYLKRLHVLGLPGGIASIYRTLGSILSFEKMQFRPAEWNPFAYVVRAHSQLMNAVFHPDFELLVNFIASGDKYKLGRDYTPAELVKQAGKPGREILKEDEVASWKHHSKDTSYEKWAVHGVLRGEKLPPLGNDRFRRVHGIEFSLN